MLFTKLFKFPNDEQKIVIIYSLLLALTISFFIFTLTSCSTAPLPDYTNNLSTITFRHDLNVEVNGKLFKGTGVIKKSDIYEISIHTTEKIDRIIYQTCHLEQVIDQPPTGWFSGAFDFTLKNIPGVINADSCSLNIIAMNEDKRINSFALLEFQDNRPEISLSATSKCNGVETVYDTGVSICQTAIGLIEQISFSEPVLQTGASPQCDVMKTDNGKDFSYFTPLGECVFYFSAQRKINGNRVSHRLTTLGYNSIPVTGVK